MADIADAATISIQQTLELLDGPFEAVAQGVAEDRYAFWLGSGISFGRVDGLRRIVPRALEFLRSQVNSDAPDCRFKAALTEALELATISDNELGRIDFAQPFSEWPDAEAITGRLINNYARLLDVQVANESSDYLLWNGVNIATTFADPNVEPDVEHLCMAILIQEGVASDVATANWDGLIERAASELTAGAASITVCVHPDNLRGPQQRAHLYKFHGCAVRAIEEEATYRPLLIGRLSQINSWAANPEHAALVNRLVNVIVSKPTLMMGLSAQDANIQALFAKAESTMSWPWPGDRPSFVFSEDKVGADQRGLLQNVYRTAYTPETRDQIVTSALVRSYAKPLLIALILHVYCSKIRHLVTLAPGPLSPAARSELQEGIVALRNRVASFGNDDRLTFMRNLIDYGSRTISLFRDGKAGDSPRPYNSITTLPIHQIAADANLAASGLREAAIAVGILGIGLRDELWTLASTDSTDPVSGIGRITSDVSSAKIFLVANSLSALRLQNNGHNIDHDDAITIFSSEIIPTAQRSPRSAPGRTGKLAPREVSIQELLSDALDSNALLQNFRTKVAI